MANEPKELIELFLTGGVGTSGEDFKVKFSRLVRTVPKIHSPIKPDFFLYFFLGGALTVQYTELENKIGIKNSCVKITSDKTIKLAFKIEKDGKIKLVFKTITVVDELEDSQSFTIDEFKEALGSLGLTSDKLNNCEVKGEIVHIKRGEPNIGELNVVEGREGKSLGATLGKIAGSPLLRISEGKAKFKKVKKNVAVSNFDNALKNFSNTKNAREGVEEFLKNLAQIYRSEKALTGLSDIESKNRMKLADSEAAYHGFTYGVMAMNFKYKYALDIRAEPIAGKGYADLMVISRYDEGKNKRWDSPLCTFEGKRGEKETAEHGVGQIERKKYDRSQSPVRAIVKTEIGQGGAAKGRVRAGFNYSLDPDHGGVLVENAPEVIEPKSFKELFFENFAPKEEIKRKLNSLYYSIVQTNGGDVNTNYLSRLILGELLADSSLEKHVVVYDDNEVWNSETYTKPIEMKGVMSTFVLKAQDGKYIILNVIERENFKIDKKIPLPEGIELSQRIQVDIRVNPEAKGGFEVEGDTGKSYYQGIEIGPPKTFQDEYKCEFKKIEHVNMLDGESKFQKQNLAEALFPLRGLIIAESAFQAVIQGLLAAQAFDERAKAEGKIVRVFTESNHSGSGRADLILSILKKDGEGQYREEKIELMELKYAKSRRVAERKRAEGETQIKNYEFNLKILTDLNKVKEHVIVFDSIAENSEDLLIDKDEDEKEIDVIHSSQDSGGSPAKRNHIPSPEEQELPKVELQASCSSSKRRKTRSTGVLCIDSLDEEDITREEKERRIKESLSNEMIMKIKLKESESKINDEVLSRHEEIEDVATYDVNKSDMLSNALQSLKLSKMLLLMSQKSEVSIELQEKAYYNALIDIGALIHDHKNHVHGDHLSALESRVQGNHLFSVAHDLYYLLKSEGNVDQDKLYSDQVKSKISSYMEGKNRLDDIYSEFSDIDIKGFFSDNDVKDFYAEAEAYDKEVITIHSTQIFVDGVEVYVEVKDSNGDHQKVVIGDIASIQNTENYTLDEKNFEIKLKIDDDKKYTITEELEEGHVKHYLNIPGGHKVKVGNIISSFTEDIKEAIHSKLNRLELLASKKYVEGISNAKITDQDYNNVISEIRQGLLQKGVSEGTFNQLKDHLDNLGEKVFAEYISDVEKKLESHGIEFDRNKFNSAKVKGAKGGKFFSFMAIYDLFDSINDVPTLGRHDNDALKQIFGINGILDAMDDVRESLSASYTRSGGKVITKISRDSAIGRVISKIPDHIRKTFVKIINSPVVQVITFATIAYQFGYSINEIVKGNHHPLNYYWTASSGIKLASMSIKPISIGVSSTMKGISATTKVLRGLSAASKVLGKAAVVTMVADVLITIGVEIHERMEYTKAIAEQVPLLPGDEQAEVFFAKVIKFFGGRDVEKEYQNKIRVKGHLNHAKEAAVKLLNDNYNIAAVVQYVLSIEEKYSEVIKSNGKQFMYRGKYTPGEMVPVCKLERKYDNIFFGGIDVVSNVKNDLSSLNVSQTLPMVLHTLVMNEGWERFICDIKNSPQCHREINEKEVYIVNTSVKHIPHLTKPEYEKHGLRIVDAPLKHPTHKLQCSKIINKKKIGNSISDPCNVNKVYKNCQETFTLSGEPFIFTKTTIGSSSPILYLTGPNQLRAAANCPAVMYVPKGRVNYRGSTDHDNTFIVNYDIYGHLIGGTESNNTVVMNYNASTISVVLHQYGFIIMEDLQPGIGLLNIHNYVSHSTANQNITTDCKTRYVDAGKGGGNNSIQNHDVDCRDQDYEIREVNKKDTHFRSTKRTTFIIDKSSGSGASIISSNNLESKKNLDIIFVKNIDIVQLKINEHQADYSLELLTDDKRSTVASTKIDSFKNLVIQVEHYGITKTIIVQDKSLPDIMKDMEYQKLNHSVNGVGSEITENSKKRSKVMILAEIKGSWDITPYEVAKDIINNNSLGIPIYLARAEKIIGNVTHEGIVESMYPGEVIADFSHGIINCNKVITIEVKSYESKCVVRFPQAHECGHLVDFTLRINNRLPDASASYKIIDLTECNINPADVECRKSSEDDIGIGVILNGYVNQRSFHIVLDDYLLSPQYQRIALQFNKGGEFYKINSASLKLEPILYNYEKKVEADYDSFRYYGPDEQGSRIYHNQPDNENKVGFIDLKDKSIFDSNMEIIDGSLVLLHNNTTFMEMKNWNTNRPTKKMVFAFNEATISDLECLFSTCDPGGIIEEFRKEIKKLISEKDKYGYTQLYYAAREGNLNLVTFLVDRGADINAVETSIEGKKPIHVAAMEGHKNVIEFFLSKGMSVNDVATGNGWTPLHYAAWQGHLEAARLLVDRGADINAVEISAEGKKPIHAAAEGNNKNIIEFLLSKGVSVNDTDKEGWTPLHWAARRNCLEAARFLVDRGADINAESSGGTTPLEIAETWGGPEIVNFLKAKKQSEYDYILLAAVENGNVSEVTDLLNRGANIEAKGDYGYTPLHYAARSGHLEVARFLVCRGASINAVSFDDKKPIHAAAEGNNKNIIEFLLSKGVSVNDTDKEGWTPLHWAARRNCLEAARFLVDRGANINAVDTTFNGGKPIHVAARGNNKNIIEFLLNKGVSVNDTDKEGWTPLHWAAWGDSLEAARFLVDRGANINAEDSRGTTPLERAETWSGAEMVNFLRAKQNEKSVQRKRRHHHGDHDRYHLSRKLLADSSNQPEIAARQDILKDSLQNGEIDYTKRGATSGASKPSSGRHRSPIEEVASEEYSENISSSATRASNPINNIVSWVKEKSGGLVSNVIDRLYKDTIKRSEGSKFQAGLRNQQDLDYDSIQEMEFQYMAKYDARKCNDKNIGAYSKKRGNGGQDRQQYESKISNKQNVISNRVNQSRIISNEKQQWSETFHGRPKHTLSHHSDKKHNFDGQPKKISERKEHTVNHKQFSSNSHKHDSQYKPMIDTNNKWSERISNEKIGNRRMIGNINQNQQNSHSSKHGHYQQGFHKYESYQQSSGTSRHPPLTRVTAQLDVPNTLILLNLTARSVTKVKDQQPHSYKCSRMPKGSMRISKDVAERMELKVKVKKGDIIWYK